MALRPAARTITAALSSCRPRFPLGRPGHIVPERVAEPAYSTEKDRVGPATRQPCPSRTEKGSYRESTPPRRDSAGAQARETGCAGHLAGGRRDPPWCCRASAGDRRRRGASRGWGPGLAAAQDATPVSADEDSTIETVSGQALYTL